MYTSGAVPLVSVLVIAGLAASVLLLISIARGFLNARGCYDMRHNTSPRQGGVRRKTGDVTYRLTPDDQPLRGKRSPAILTNVNRMILFALPARQKAGWKALRFFEGARGLN